MTEKTIQRLSFITAIISLLVIFSQPVFAGIVWSGDIDPDDPATWTSSIDGYIGKSADGTLDIDGGSIVTNARGYIGDAVGVNGEVTVNGTDSTWTNSSYLYVGNYGNGILDITNGGTVSISSGSATVGCRADSISSITVEDANSLMEISYGIRVGDYGNGTLNIKGAGKVTCNALSSSIGYRSGSTGKVTVNGIYSTWAHASSSSGIYVGYSGNGTLDISDGGVVSVRDAWVSYGADSISKVIVDGPGSTWNVNVPGGQGQVVVGLQGNGTVEITNGGTVTNNYGYIGSNVNSTGKVTVSGPNSSWTCNKSLRVGNYGNGTMIIKNGALITNQLECYIGAELNSTGDVLVVGPGSTWTCDDPLHVGRNGSGTLMIANGGLVSVDNALTIDTDLDGDGFVYMMSGGQLALDRNGSAAITDITSFLALINGTAALKYWDGVNWYGIQDATAGEDYTLENITTGDLDGFTVLTVHTPGPPDPDVDADGDVDMQDFADLAFQWGAVGCDEPGWCGRADIDYSHDVGISDLEILTAQWLEGVE